MTADTTYNYRVVRQFTWAAIIFGIVGMLVGVIIAAQLRWPNLFGGIEWLVYSRLRPVHTSGVIFAFGGNALFATSYYIVQRVCSVRLISDKIAAFTFYGYQTTLVLGVLSYVLGYSQSKEYAELPWLLDILLAVVWVAYAYVFFFTIGKRKEKHIYVGLWFYGAYIIAVAILHIFNNLALPIDWLHSYPIYSGAVDAMAQWWYGHNAVGFFLTAAFLGMMYYFVPKQAGRPIYSYRLSIVHFWALISIYMWAGPHHLHYTALPDWTQSLGMAFSVVLWVPSWGGMINGMMTLSGAWNKLITDPIIRFLFVALSFYGMSTFEGPMMAIKEVNALSHYTEWTVGHVHSGALGWVAMITMGSLYHMLPRLYGKTEMYSTRLIFVHFWLATIGIVLYVTSMWVAGIMEGLLWRETAADGSLTYSFIEILSKKYIFYFVRFLGGTAFLSGMCLMAYNCWKTAFSGSTKRSAVEIQAQPV
ncbi:MAG: cytochrome-c oxidase, cbb3-type subunit I [Cardiobacteriaceae bacterium]|nr:cytochrome-c oxidase, cbb3-type subunit I [Cardiobacteriaceae bacterium]